MRSLKLRPALLLGAIAAALALGGAGVWAVSPQTADDLVVHEWGTFLSMSGSDGTTLDGMYHEEHALPAFVHARSRDQLWLPSVILKGETPIIYFYTNRRQKSHVDVRFPKGLWTQWYPQAQVVGPQFSQAASPLELREGRIVWCPEIIPAGAGAAEPPRTASDALWNFARQVDAAYVRTRDGTKQNGPGESERFLFYRGLGQAPLPVRFTGDSGGTLEVARNEPHGASHVFILRVEGGRGTFAYHPALKPGQTLTDVIPSMDDAQPLEQFTAAIARELRLRLVKSGLFEREAEAMVNTWRNSYFGTEGVRALFVLPQTWTDAFIPLTITPRPREIVRVMVGRIELLTAERERRAEQSLHALASPDAAARERAFVFLREQGRYVEPIIRRVLRTTDDARLRTVCRRLLTTDFVTDLRAAIHNAADGSRRQEDPVFIRAQLASLLRELGLETEAKAEGQSALRALQGRPVPPMNDSDSRQYLRAVARAQEGIGDDRGAAGTYARFIRFGSQVRTNKDCRGCHQDAGPQDMVWFRDWWVGQRYAALTAKLGQTDRAIAEHEAALAKDSEDTAARLALAYLYGAKGDQRKARAFWTVLIAPAQTKLSAISQPPRAR